jgi:hypothetical protein
LKLELHNKAVELSDTLLELQNLQNRLQDSETAFESVKADKLALELDC